MTAPSPIAALPEPRNAEGAIRTVGVEIEFGGLTPVVAAGIVSRVLGGEIEQRDRYRYAIHTEHGKFTVELDTRWAHPDHVETYAADLPEDMLPGDVRKALARDLSETAGAVLSNLFPTELVCPPLPYDQLDLLRPLSDILASNGALGTAHSAFAGFGMHLNVEVASLTVEHILSVTRAYLLLDFWLRRESRIALIRQLQSYIEPFPEAYKRHVLSPDYAPDLETFMDDHMRFNPSRDMELDLLPIFALIDPERVKAALPDVKNSPRPTFHWRLPNCRIDEPDWEPGQDWERWVAVESLAADGEQLEKLSRAYLRDGPASDIEARLRRFVDQLG